MVSVHARLATAIGVLALVASAGLTAPAASAATAAKPYDFNGDGFADLAAGVPGEDAGSTTDSGAVNVIYGSAAGLTASGDQVWAQDSRGVPGSAEPRDRFGTATASGDFDGDGFADLAVGAPGETVGGEVEAGAVNVLYGSRRGLRSTDSRLFSQATRGVPGTPVADDQFGGALVAGDFNGDHRADLAIAASHDTLGPDPLDRGSVTVLLGSRSGLRTTGAQKWDDGSIFPTWVGDGYTLDAGDVNGDGRDELAVQAPGAVALLVGAPKGLTTTGAEVWDDARVDIHSALRRPGSIVSMSLGDLNGDGRADLAVGSHGAHRSNEPFDDCGMSSLCEGAVAVLPASADPSQLLTTSGRQVLDLSTARNASALDFGNALETGDLDGDGRDELCAATGNDPSEGTVVVVHFEAGPGIRADASRDWEQAAGQVMGTYERTNGFAETLKVGQYGRSSQADLAIAVAGATIGTAAGAGRVAVLYGSADGVTATGQQSWSQASSGIRGTAEAGDGFGVLGR